MLDKGSIAIIGYSGHAYVVLETARLLGTEIIGYCEKSQVLKNPYNLKYLGFEGDKEFDWGVADKFVLAIGENNQRTGIGKYIKSKSKHLVNIIHPTASMSYTVKVGWGNFIGTNVIINALVDIGDYCILNTGSIIEHECKIADGVHIAPGAVLAGNVKIGQNTFIGANAVIKQGINIGKNVIIGAGSVVVGDIPDNQVWVGNPAKLLKR